MCGLNESLQSISGVGFFLNGDPLMLTSLSKWNSLLSPDFLPKCLLINTKLSVVVLEASSYFCCWEEHWYQQSCRFEQIYTFCTTCSLHTGSDHNIFLFLLTNVEHIFEVANMCLSWLAYFVQTLRAKTSSRVFNILLFSTVRSRFVKLRCRKNILIFFFKEFHCKRKYQFYMKQKVFTIPC